MKASHSAGVKLRAGPLGCLLSRTRVLLPVRPATSTQLPLYALRELFIHSRQDSFAEHMPRCPQDGWDLALAGVDQCLCTACAHSARSDDAPGAVDCELPGQVTRGSSYCISAGQRTSSQHSLTWRDARWHLAYGLLARRKLDNRWLSPRLGCRSVCRSRRGDEGPWHHIFAGQRTVNPIRMPLS